MQEIEWRDIPGYNGRYSASASGHFYNNRKGCYIKQRLASDGRLLVPLTVNGELKFHKAQYLVMITFVGPRPTGHHIHHKNRNYQDNRLENLEYISPEEHSALHVEMRKAARPPVEPKPVKIPKPPPLRQQLITEINTITNYNPGYQLHNLGLSALKDILSKLKEQVTE